MALTLYGEEFWISPYVFTCFVVLREKGVPFEMRELFLGKGEHKKPELADKLLTGKVPALDHDGFFVSESLAVVEYIEDSFPAPKHPRMLPESIRDRARARQIMAWTRSDLLALKEQRPTTTMFYERAKTKLEGEARASADKLLHVADLCVRDGATSMFGSFCAADADLAFALHRLILNGDDIPKKLRTYAEAIWQRPSVREYCVRDRIPYVPHG